MTFSPSLKFRLRTLLIVTTAVAVSLGVWLERRRYLRTHLFVDVVDSASGTRLSRFQYCTEIITSNTKPGFLDPMQHWSEWTEHQGASTLVLPVPEHCETHLAIRAVDLDGGYVRTEHTQLVLPEISHSITIRMTQGQQLDGVVIDRETKKPIKDAVVQVTSDRDLWVLTDDLVLTDELGRFKLRNLDAKCGVLVYHSHYEEHSVVPDSIADPISIELTKARRVTGKVICRETGSPISECEIAQPDRTRWSNRGHELYTTTDDQGKFEIFIDESKHEVVEVRKYGWFDHTFVEVTDANEITIPIDFYPYVLSGRVVDENGQPVSDSYMRVDSPNNDEEHRDSEIEHVSDSNGAFLFRRKNPIVAISARGQGHGLFRRDFPIPSKPMSFQDQTITLPKGTTLRGKVTGGKAGVRVELQLLHHDQSLFPGGSLYRNLYSSQTQANGQGEFQFEHVTQGMYTLLTKYNGFLVNQRQVAVRNELPDSEEIVLPSTGSVSGVAKGQDGLPIPFRCFYLGDSQYDRRVWFRTNHRGEFRVDHVPSGSHELGPSTSSGISEPFEIIVAAEKATQVSFEEMTVVEMVGFLDSEVRWVDLDFSRVGLGQHFTYASNSVETPTRFLGRQLSPGEYDARINFRSNCSTQSIEARFGISFQKNLDTMEFRQRTLRLDFTDKMLRGLDIAGLHQRARESYPIRYSQLRYSQPIVIEWSDDSNDFVETKTDVVSTAPVATNWKEGDHTTTVFLIADKSMQSKIKMSELEQTISILLPRRDPDTCILHNPQLGWARVENLVVGETEALANAIRFQPGATLRVRIRLEGLKLLPTGISIRNAGTSFSAEIENCIDGQTFLFPELWPGEWTLELIGKDPRLGTQVLLKRDVRIEGTEVVEVEPRP